MLRSISKLWKPAAVCGLVLGLAWLWSAHEVEAGKPKPPPPPSTHDLVVALQLKVLALETLLGDHDDLLQYAHVSDETINGLAGPHVIFEACNVHVRNGADSTYLAQNGLGNLIVGYNANPVQLTRCGSHNMVIGDGHEYGETGGFVAGYANKLQAHGASVCGGDSNTASGLQSVVSGGQQNEASGPVSVVSGGTRNAASGSFSTVAGGFLNEASGGVSTVSGGADNVASVEGAAVSGGFDNTASGQYSAVSGGFGNTASGPHSTVSGGFSLLADDDLEHLP